MVGIRDASFVNPLQNPIFYDVAWRFLWVFVAGFLLILILNKFRLKGLMQKELGKRYLSWLVIGVLFMGFVFLGGLPALILSFVLMVLAISEIGMMAKLPKINVWAMYILAALSVITASYFEAKFYMLPILYFTILTTLTIRRNDKKGFFALAVSLYTSIWIIFFLSHFILLGHLNNSLDNTKALLLMIGFAVPLADVGAYVFGKLFSKSFLVKYKIADKISPHKIWAGMIGDFVGAGIGIWIMSFALSSYFSFWQMFILAIAIGIFSVVGDMNESLLKRYFNVKDSGKLIPGHGGILDRIDSVLRVVVVVYYLSVLFLG